MKLAARLISLYFIIFILPSSVLGGNCSDEELESLGMLDKPDPVKERLFLTSKAMTTVGKRHGLRPGTPKEKFQRELTKLLGSLGISGVSEQCLGCFAQSIKCVSQHCKGACLRGPCTQDCQKCIERNCKDALLECIGKQSILNPCTWESEYLKFKLPETGEDESEKKGEASGTS
uniref:CD8+ T cell target antigen Tp2 n=1 Tax=Theileria parva TaxID=5875 RepID=F6LWL4_THEPA|nr:CD8+ T cell target antigen Tp2 [Theileria parva]AEG42580.1 CD8+ T cell target antigen Tp2 [Theileria parva]